MEDEKRSNITPEVCSALKYTFSSMVEKSEAAIIRALRETEKYIGVSGYEPLGKLAYEEIDNGSLNLPYVPGIFSDAGATEEERNLLYNLEVDIGAELYSFDIYLCGHAVPRSQSSGLEISDEVFNAIKNGIESEMNNAKAAFTPYYSGPDELSGPFIDLCTDIQDTLEGWTYNFISRLEAIERIFDDGVSSVISEAQGSSGRPYTGRLPRWNKEN